MLGPVPFWINFSDINRPIYYNAIFSIRLSESNVYFISLGTLYNVHILSTYIYIYVIVCQTPVNPVIQFVQLRKIGNSGQ